MYILGISAFYHDSAAALVRDGDIGAAVLTMDGVGEWTTASFGTGIDNNISIQRGDAEDGAAYP